MTWIKFLVIIFFSNYHLVVKMLPILISTKKSLWYLLELQLNIVLLKIWSPTKSKWVLKRNVFFFFVTVSQYLIVNMHFEVKPLKDVQFIHPLKRNDPHATNAISHLALYFIEVFGIKFFLVFNNNSNVIKKELCDIICSHWQSH